MKIPQLQKKPELKSCHNKTWEDNYSWIHQKNILEVLKDSSKLLPEVRKYLEEEKELGACTGQATKSEAGGGKGTKTGKDSSPLEKTSEESRAAQNDILSAGFCNFFCGVEA